MEACFVPVHAGSDERQASSLERGHRVREAHGGIVVDMVVGQADHVDATVQERSERGGRHPETERLGPFGAAVCYRGLQIGHEEVLGLHNRQEPSENAGRSVRLLQQLRSTLTGHHVAYGSKPGQPHRLPRLREAPQVLQGSRLQPPACGRGGSCRNGFHRDRNGADERVAGISRIQPVIREYPSRQPDGFQRFGECCGLFQAHARGID